MRRRPKQTEARCFLATHDTCCNRLRYRAVRILALPPPPSLVQLPPSAPPLLRGMWARSLTSTLADDDDSDHHWHHYPARGNDR